MTDIYPLAREPRGAPGFATVPAGIILFDAGGRIRFSNEAARQILGSQLAGIAGGTARGYTLHRPDGSIFPPQALPLPQALAGGRAISEVEIRLRRPSGRERHLLVTAVPYRDAAGELSGAVTVLQDVTELRLEEQELRRRREAFRVLAETSPDIVIQIDRGLKPLAISPASCALPDPARPAPAAPPVGTVPDPAIPEVLVKASAAACLEVFATGQEVSGSYQISLPSGPRYCFEVRHAPEFGPDGSVDAVLLIARDITSRREAARELTEKSQQLAGLFEHAPVGMALFDAEPPYRVLAHNRVYQEVFPEPFRSQGMVGRAFPEYVPLAEESGILEVFREVARSRLSRTVYEFAYDGLARGRTWWNWHLSPILRGRNVTAFAHTLIEVTDSAIAKHRLEQVVRERTARLKEREEALERSEKRLAMAVEASGAGLFEHAVPAGRYSYFSERFAGILGFRREEVPIGEGVEEWLGGRIHPEDQPQARSTYLQFAEGRTPTFDVEARVRHRDGRWVYVRTMSRAARRGPDGRVEHVVGVLLDISEQKRVEEELARRKAIAEDRAVQLQKLTLEMTEIEQRERRRMAQVLHDHLQQLLVAAKLQLGSALGQPGGAPSGERLPALLGQVQDLLDRSIDVSRSLTYELSPPALYARGLSPALEWLGRWMEDKYGLQVEFHGQPAAGRPEDGTTVEEPEAEGVRVMLFQVARELLFNVVKHSGVKRSRLTLGRSPQGEEVVLVVEDQGNGFDPVGLQRKRRADNGFGLFALRERLELFGGRMEIESSPGRGARFTVRAPTGKGRPWAELEAFQEQGPPEPAGPAGLPDASRPAGVSPMPGAEPATAGFEQAGTARRIRVLLADDHAMMRQGLISLLQSQPDIEVAGEASNGRMAVDLAHSLHPDIVLMDVSMPQMNGIEATRRIRQELPDIRVIGLSMYIESATRDAMLRAGATRYLTKDGAIEQLLEAIRDNAPASHPPGH
jgi:PAS domain S-box-containing protein